MTRRSFSVNRLKPYLTRPASIALVAAMAFAAVPRPAEADTPRVDFNRQIRPILAEHCLACHGPDEAARQADLRLDIREAAIEMGAIAAGDAEGSELVRRILRTDESELMPPPDSHKKLSPEQIELLRLWVEQGAEYELHWSFEPPRMPDVPEVENLGWARNAIDRFILAKHDALGIAASAEADLTTLVRRVSLDLTGLPPTPEELQRVLSDPAPDRYERYVDRLLASPAWGEHRGRHWLDYARYADTHGIHFDNYREVYAYRDWVIKAFNANMPFDQFTVEQLAGDLLPQPTLDQQIATGFHRCNITTNEGGIIDEEYVVLYARDRVETTGAVWLGLTVGCAVCHDHKFDPVSQREFYELAAFFNNTTQPPRDGNVKDTPPIVKVPPDADRNEYFQLLEKIAGDEKRAGELRGSLEADLAGRAAERMLSAANQVDAADAPAVAGTLVLHAAADRSGPLTTTVATAKGLHRISLDEVTGGEKAWVPGVVSDNALLLNGKPLQVRGAETLKHDEPFFVSLWIQPRKANLGGAVVAQMDSSAAHRGWDVWMEGGKIGMHVINRWPENALKVVSSEKLPVDKWSHVTFEYDGSKKAAGFKLSIGGQAAKYDVTSDGLTAEIATEVPLQIGGRSGGEGVQNVAVQDVRIYRGSVTGDWQKSWLEDPRFAHLLRQQAAGKLVDADRPELVELLAERTLPEYAQLQAELAAAQKRRDAILAAGTIAHVMAEKPEPAKAYVLFRGEYDQRRDEVTPKTPAVLPPMDPSLPKNRLGLARWLVAPENPLTARVTVNRFWQEVFGRGLVATSGDFGITGEQPTHPELLDYLAIDFQRSGWDVKALFRQIVTSSTYRQSSCASQGTLAADPDNRYLSRGPRFRMDAETLRDLALHASGLLRRQLGGRSVRPYQPEGVWEAVAMPGSDTRFYKQDDASGLYRRSMYTFWKRAAPPASMDIFNAPNRETVCVRRERTNTPLQALVTMNDPQFVEAARVLAAETIRGDGDDRSKIQQISLTVLSRELTGKELQVVGDLLRDARGYYAAQPTDAASFIAIGESKIGEDADDAELAAWTLVANQILNLDEALCK